MKTKAERRESKSLKAKKAMTSFSDQIKKRRPTQKPSAIHVTKK